MMSTTSNNNSSSTTNRWAPICYPSATIFGSANYEGGGSTGIRTADPFFPLHRDVLLAAMRELLIIDGKIDARTMKVVVPFQKEETTCNVSIKYESSEKKRARSAAAETNRDDALPTLSDDDDEDMWAPSLSKKQRVDSILDLQKNQKPSASSQPNIVPTAEKKSFDYSQFDSAEELVKYVVDRATSLLGSASKTGIYAEPTTSSTEEQTVTSKRKVSDVDDMEAQDAKAASFPSCIVSLIRSNTKIFQTFSSGAPNSLTKLKNSLPTSLLTEREKNIFHSSLSSQMTMTELLPRGTENFEKTNDAIIEFLRRPQLHRQRQQGNANKSLFVLPQLLEASMTDESYLREFAHNMIVSMVDSIPGNDFEVPLRVFLGYKSKTPSRERLLDMICGVLFDVSHAMHAWVFTEKDITRKLQVSKDAMNSKDMDEHIKNALFDQNHRAIKNIGGFDDSSLLPLALGIHRCRQEKTTWREFATSAEGKNAFSLHYATADKSTKVQRGQNDIVGTGLFETGRKRRGRRGRSINSPRINAY